MERIILERLLREIRGCTFASIDTATKPKPGITHVQTGSRVLLFASVNGVSGYENMVRRRLESLGIDPEAFNVGPLPWGERVDNLPLISHRGFYYLQTLQLSEGESHYYIGRTEIPEKQLPAFGITTVAKGSPAGLPKELKIVIQTYSLENIQAIRLLGWEAYDNEMKRAKKKPRKKLSLFNKGG